MLHVTRGVDGEDLLAVLADTLARPLTDPLSREVVVVANHGIERWISQRLSDHLGVATGNDGVCANVDFPTPADVVSDVLTGLGHGPAVAAWHPRALSWRLLGLVDGGLPEALEPLAERVARAGDRRMVPLTLIASHLHRYALHRPDVILRWLTGHDDDGTGGTLAPEDAWQAELYRVLSRTIDTRCYAEVVTSAISALDEDAGVAALQRLHLFGFSAVPAAHMALLTALGRRLDVHMLLRHPSPANWAAGSHRAGEVGLDGLPRLPTPQPARRTGSRLLQAWGREAAELQVLVQTVTTDAVTQAPRTGRLAAEGTVLGRLQRLLVGDTEPTGDHPPDPDESLQFHACPGPARQVQVLRDEILRLLAADPTLRPRDIVVMCPDVEVFAPLVTAHLAGGDRERPDLRVRLADRSLRQTNPLLKVLDEVLRMAATRVTTSGLLDLLASEPVRRRFRLADRDTEEIGEWLVEAGARWGMDAADRERFNLAGLRANTVAEAMDRLLLGVAMADEGHRSVGGITPFDDMEGSSVDVVGRLAEAVERLTVVLRRMRQPMPVREWPAVLAQAVDMLSVAAGEEPWQRAELADLLDQLRRDGRGINTDVGLMELTDLLADRLRGSPSRANHMTGDLTVCTLVPMRTVPHRVVCLLGMDDGTFPRQAQPHVDDLLARYPRIADPDVGTQDRQLLLDAVLSASDAVVVTYTGIDSRSGMAVPPCVPITELRRTVDGMAPAAAEPLSTALTHTHPLYAHDPKAFTAGRPSFDAIAHRAATPASPVATTRELPELDGDVVPAAIDTTGLRRFLEMPALAFVRRVLGVYLPDNPSVPDEHIPFDVGGLDRWKIGEALLQAGVGPDDEEERVRVIAAIRGRGLLPPSPLGDDDVERAADTAAQIADVVEAMGLAAYAEIPRLDLDLTVAGHRLQGGVDGLLGDRLVTVTFSRLADKRLLRSWLDLLLITAHDPTRPVEAITIGKQKVRGGEIPAAVRFPPLGSTPGERADVAAARLADLVTLHGEGMRTPLLAPAKTAYAYARARLADADPAEADAQAAQAWDPSDRGWDTDGQHPAHRLLLGGVEPYDLLATRPVRPTDTPDGARPEAHHLAGVAMRIWAPLLRHCDEVTLR